MNRFGDRTIEDILQVIIILLLVFTFLLGLTTIVTDRTCGIIVTRPAFSILFRFTHLFTIQHGGILITIIIILITMVVMPTILQIINGEITVRLN